MKCAKNPGRGTRPAERSFLADVAHSREIARLFQDRQFCELSGFSSLGLYGLRSSSASLSKSGQPKVGGRCLGE